MGASHSTQRAATSATITNTIISEQQQKQLVSQSCKGKVRKADLSHIKFNQNTGNALVPRALQTRAVAELLDRRLPQRAAKVEALGVDAVERATIVEEESAATVLAA